MWIHGPKTETGTKTSSKNDEEKNVARLQNRKV